MRAPRLCLQGRVEYNFPRFARHKQRPTPKPAPHGPPACACFGAAGRAVAITDHLSLITGATGVAWE